MEFIILGLLLGQSAQDQLRGYHLARLCEERTCLFRRSGVHLLEQGLIRILESTALWIPWFFEDLLSQNFYLSSRKL